MQWILVEFGGFAPNEYRVSSDDFASVEAWLVTRALPPNREISLQIAHTILHVNTLSTLRENELPQLSAKA